MISIGKRVNYFSGAADGIVNFVFRYFFDDTMKSFSTATTSEDMGRFFGYWFKTFFTTELSAYQRDFNVIDVLK